MPATFTETCPHCHAENMTFPIFGIGPVPAERPIGRLPYVSVAADCQRCGSPVVAQLMIMMSEQDQRDIAHRARELMTRTDDVLQSWFQVAHIWPLPQATVIPAHLPTEVERAFVQAERNYQMEGCEEPAALMYRRSLELAIKSLHPAGTGSLAARIKKMIEQHELPKPIGEWLTQTRLIGNDGAHEAAGVAREDLVDARAFTDTTLRYLFTLPAQIKARQKLAQNA